MSEQPLSVLTKVLYVLTINWRIYLVRCDTEFGFDTEKFLNSLVTQRKKHNTESIFHPARV